jgi:ferritin
MIKPKVLEVMNEQIKHELESYYVYLSMAAYFHDQNLDGMAHWMRAQAHEEMEHAMKFFDHIIDRGGQVKLLDLKQEKTDWSSPLEAFEDAYAHEQFITDKINTIMDVVRQERDYAAEPMLSWFVDEQIEEEASTSKVVEELKRSEGSRGGLFMIDRELGGRAFPSGSPLDPATYQPAEE